VLASGLKSSRQQTQGRGATPLGELFRSLSLLARLLVNPLTPFLDEPLVPDVRPPDDDSLSILAVVGRLT